MRERSRAKSSAAKMRPERYGDAAQMEERAMSDFADSMSAMIERGFSEDEEEWRDGRVCFITSVTKWRSAAEFTFGTMIVSRLGALSCFPFR